MVKVKRVGGGGEAGRGKGTMTARRARCVDHRHES